MPVGTRSDQVYFPPWQLEVLVTSTLSSSQCEWLTEEEFEDLPLFLEGHVFLLFISCLTNDKPVFFLFEGFISWRLPMLRWTVPLENLTHPCITWSTMMADLQTTAFLKRCCLHESTTLSRPKDWDLNIFFFLYTLWHGLLYFKTWCISSQREVYCL